MYPEFAKEINSSQMQNKNKNKSKKDFGYESVCVCVCVNIFTWNHKELQNNNHLKRNKNIIKKVTIEKKK